MAYLAREGHQSMAEIMAMTLDDAQQLANALGRLITRENGPEP